MNLKDNLLNTQTWIRLVLILLFWIPRCISIWIVNAVAAAQFLFVLITGRKSDYINNFSLMLGSYLLQIVDYQTFVTDQAPFPLSEFPDDNRKVSSENTGFID